LKENDMEKETVAPVQREPFAVKRDPAPLFAAGIIMLLCVAVYAYNAMIRLERIAGMEIIGERTIMWLFMPLLTLADTRPKPLWVKILFWTLLSALAGLLVAANVNQSAPFIPDRFSNLEKPLFVLSAALLLAGLAVSIVYRKPVERRPYKLKPWHIILIIAAPTLLIFGIFAFLTFIK